jgi:hypothetical protein
MLAARHAERRQRIETPKRSIPLVNATRSSIKRISARNIDRDAFRAAGEVLACPFRPFTHAKGGSSTMSNAFRPNPCRR